MGKYSSRLVSSFRKIFAKNAKMQKGCWSVHSYLDKMLKNDTLKKCKTNYIIQFGLICAKLCRFFSTAKKFMSESFSEKESKNYFFAANDVLDYGNLLKDHVFHFHSFCWRLQLLSKMVFSGYFSSEIIKKTNFKL